MKMKYCTSNQSPFGLEIPNTSEIKIIKTPAGYETPEELIKYYSEEAHIRMIESMKLEYKGTATCNDCSGKVTIPPYAPITVTIQKYLNPARE